MNHVEYIHILDYTFQNIFLNLKTRYNKEPTKIKKHIKMSSTMMQCSCWLRWSMQFRQVSPTHESKNKKLKEFMLIGKMRWGRRKGSFNINVMKGYFGLLRIIWGCSLNLWVCTMQSPCFCSMQCSNLFFFFFLFYK